MNVTQLLHRRLPVLTLSLGAISLLAGCINIPPAVKNSVDRSREGLQQLHIVHAQDARAFARVVNEHEVYVKETSDVLRRALRDKCEAEMELSKARLMSTYDRRAAQILGIEFQDKLKNQVFPKFDRLERTNLRSYVEAISKRTRFPADVGVDAEVEAAQREIFEARIERENLASGYFLAIDAALKNARFRFQTEVDQKYAERLQPLLDDMVKNVDGGAKLAAFNARIEKKLAELDESYNSLDQALSDLSTYLDSEAMSRRFAAHFWKGAASALVEDLAEGKLGGANLSEIFDMKNSPFSREVQKVEAALENKAGEAANSATQDVKAPAPQKAETNEKGLVRKEGE